MSLELLGRIEAELAPPVDAGPPGGEEWLRVEQVVDRPEDEHARERWMLAQADDARMSYVREMLDDS